MGQIMVIPSWPVPDLWPLTLIGAALLALLLAGRVWRVDLPGDPLAPQSRSQAALRRLNRFQLRRPALVPTPLTFGALAIAVGVRMAIPTPPARDTALPGLAGTYSVGILTVLALLAGIVTGFTFVTIGTLGETFTPLLADPAIRAPWLWRFLGFSLAGTATALYEALFPPKVSQELIVQTVCFILAVLALVAHLRSVAADSNPAALLRRLVDNDTPPVGFREWAGGRVVQVGLTATRQALRLRDGPTAAAVTTEVVRVCAAFQSVLLRLPTRTLADPGKTFGLDYIPLVQSEFHQWVDELALAGCVTPAAFEAAGQLLTYPPVWEATVAARLALALALAGEGELRTLETEPDDLTRDLVLPLRRLLGAERPTEVPESTPEVLRVVQRLTTHAAALGGAVAVVTAVIAALDREATAPRPLTPVTTDMVRRIAADLTTLAAHLAVEYAAHLHDAGRLDTYEQQTLRSVSEPVVQAYHALWATLGELRAPRDQARRTLDTPGDHVRSDPAACDFLDALTAPLQVAMTDRASTAS